MSVSVALQGNLEDFGIADVFQLIGQQRKTGVIEFAGRHQTVEIFFDSGKVVRAAKVGLTPYAALAEMLVRCGMLTRERADELGRDCETSAQPLSRIAVVRGWLSETEVAEIEDLLTRETIFDLLRWQEGSFDFWAQNVEHERPETALLGAEQILMDGLRMVDEWQAFAEHVPSDQVVFRRIADFDVYREQASRELSRQLDVAERLFFLVDGRLAVRRVIDLSLIGTFEATRILVDLVRTGVIESVERSTPTFGPTHSRMRGFAGAPRLWLQSGVPLLLLLGVMLMAWPDTAPVSGSPSFPVSREALGEVRTTYAARGVRNALSAYRFMEGRWPATLGALSDAGLVSLDALASPAGRPYYYVQRADAVLLLAPEHGVPRD